MTNCPNCGAPIEPYKCRCGYCGTYYFDFTAFDMTGEDPYYVKFKANSFGKDVIITALAKPTLETCEITDEPVYATDKYGNVLMQFSSNRSCDLNVRFRCQQNHETKSLFQVECLD